MICSSVSQCAGTRPLDTMSRYEHFDFDDFHFHSAISRQS